MTTQRGIYQHQPHFRRRGQRRARQLPLCGPHQALCRQRQKANRHIHTHGGPGVCRQRRSVQAGADPGGPALRPVRAQLPDESAPCGRRAGGAVPVGERIFLLRVTEPQGAASPQRSPARYSWAEWTAMAPSATAVATWRRALVRTSPAANRPGTSVRVDSSATT